MKYFTWKLLQEYGSSNDRIADVADDKWEDAGKRYRRYQTRIRPKFPEDLKKILEKHALHDAKFRVLGLLEEFFLLEIQFPAPSASLGYFAYDVSSDPAIEKKDAGKTPLVSILKQDFYWLYHELSWNASRKELAHAILFESAAREGYEMTIPFTDFFCLEVPSRSKKEGLLERFKLVLKLLSKKARKAV